MRPFELSATRLGFDEYDIANQGLRSHHFEIEGERLSATFTPLRYVWPSELDLMARLAGMTLSQRWGDWDRTPFTSESTKHVSVWEKTAKTPAP